MTIVKPRQLSQSHSQTRSGCSWTRLFYADSLPGGKAHVVRFWDTPKGVFVRCNYGKNLSGKSLLKTRPANVLALA